MYRVDIENQDNSSFKIRSQGYEFVVSNKEREGISPPAALLASLGSCIGVYARRYLEGAGLGSSGLKISLEAGFDKEKPVRLKTINVSVNLGNVQLDERRKEAFLVFIKNCPVHNTLEAKPTIDVKLQ